MKLKNIIINEIVNYLKEDDYFDTELPEEIKKHSNRYIGIGVTWFGDPDQMIVINKNQIHGMWGNIYDSEKLEFVKNLILNSEDNVEFECSYGIGDLVTFTDIKEHQEANEQNRFEIDYDGYEKPLSIGDDELDNYIGSEDIEDSEILYYESYDDPDLYDLLNKNKFFLVNGKSIDQLKREIEQLKQKNKQEIGEEFTDTDLEFIEAFINVEKELYDAVRNNDGDLDTFMVQLRDGHHRVMGAIAAGERNVCVNLDKDDIVKYDDYITRVRTKWENYKR